MPMLSVSIPTKDFLEYENARASYQGLGVSAFYSGLLRAAFDARKVEEAAPQAPPPRPVKPSRKGLEKWEYDQALATYKDALKAWVEKYGQSV